MRIRSLATVLALLCLAISGCSLLQGIENQLHYNDVVNDFVMGWRNGAWAQNAWHEQKFTFDGHPQFRDFGAGFRAGYIAVAGGGNGCPPPLPPRHYWSWKYQTPEGQCKVAAWFEGFPDGAQAADQDNAGEFQDIQVSYSIETQYSPEFQAGQFPGEFNAGNEGEVLPEYQDYQDYPSVPLPEVEAETDPDG